MERLVLGLLALVLALRYPVHFLLQPPFLMDFEVYRAVASRVLAGQGGALYAPTTAGSDMMVFKYGPPWALLWAPLGWLPQPLAVAAWTMGSLAALIVTLALAARCCRAAGLRPHPLLALPATFLILRPLGEEMGNGQVNLLWAGLTVWAIWAVMRRRPWSAAGALAAAILLKLPAAAYLPYLALRGQRRVAAATIAIMAAAVALSSAALAPAHPLQPALDWVQGLTRSGTSYAFVIGNQSILALLGRLLTADGHGLNIAALPQAALPWLALALLAVALACIIAPAPRPHDSRRFLYDSALLAAVMVLFSPSAWLATYAALLFPAYVAGAGLAQPGARRDAPAWALAALVAILVWFTHRKAWTLLGLTIWRGETYVFLVFMVLPWLGLALLALLWRLRRRAAGRSA